MSVAAKTVEQRKPGAGAAEKSREALLIGAAGMIDELGPAIAVARDRAHGLERDGRVGAVQSLDQSVPGDIEPQILRLVDDARAVLEADDLDRTAAIVRIGKFAFDLGDAAGGAGRQKIAADGRADRHRGAGRIRATYRSTAASVSAISRNSTGLSSNRRRKPPAFMAATN